MNCKEPLAKKTDRDPRYELHIESRRKNVFVTQLGERRDEEEENINHIPVIREAASKILEGSKSTQQTTLVLKKEVEADSVNEQLSAKRREFQHRMEAVTRRREELDMKQQLNKESALKFEKFLKDTDAKKQRAIHKYQVEVKQNDLKQRELLELLQQSEDLKARQQKLYNKLAKNKIFEHFLQKTVDILPENYIEYGADSSVIALIRRYETLSATNEALVNSQVTLASELEMAQRQLEALQREHETIKLMTNSELSQLQMEHDKILEKNKELDLKINLHRGYFRHQSEELGSLIMAVTNLADDCYMRHYGQLQDMDILTKLDMIKEFIIEKKNIEQMAALSEDCRSPLSSAIELTTNKEIGTTQLKSKSRSSLGSTGKTQTLQNIRSKSASLKA
ncbi:uncharacterized protein CCDC197 isoform X1 [Protopterus annectens]|uniref:uncharacterized protein CCDC197 isoform X1 n=1 Tax=Protopterus annectens TaxID=7888 RepID=UPI001CFA04A4|nr:uncharacterized protein CCDC197 isoform X1 [Protopterus annectens]XP_043930517.1 uncharacterized protein CCDC197 isoform X1 [Protopterus annectens]